MNLFKVLILMFSIGVCNATTNNIIQEKILYYINYYCKEYSTKKIKIDPDLIMAIVKKECSFQPYSIRYEKHLIKNKKYVYWIPKKHRKDKLSYSSLGAGQVLYGTARSMGFKGEPADLLLCKNSIKYCVKYIKDLIKRYYILEDVISSYNQGSPRKNKNGKLKNYDNYVNPVIVFYYQFKGKIK